MAEALPYYVDHSHALLERELLDTVFEPEEKPPVGLRDLPEELHLMILGNLDDRRDVINCSHAWGWWNNVLRPQKPTFLAPGALPCLLPYLDTQDILNCRVQCKTWKHTLDKALTYGPYRVRTPPEMQFFPSVQDISPELDIFNKAYLEFHTSEEIDMFTAILDTTSVNVDNPFIWRALSFDFRPKMVRALDGPRRTQDEYQEFYERGFALLTRYGNLIWRFKYTLPDISQLRWPQLTLRSQFLALMRLIKNVRSLELEELLPPAPLTDERLERSPAFPRLRFLKELHFPKHSSTYTRFMQQLVAHYGCQLQAFNMHGSLFHKYVYWLPLREQRLLLSEVCPNLIHLTVRGFTNPCLWQLTRCTSWRNLRQFQLILSDENCCEDHKSNAEVWCLLKVIYQLVSTARHLEELKVDLNEPDQLPFILYKKGVVTINGTFDHDLDNDDIFARSSSSSSKDDMQMKLRVPTAIVAALKKARHLVIKTYKRTPINGFSQFEDLKKRLMPLDIFWQMMPWLRSVAFDITLYDAEAKMEIFTDRVMYERPRHRNSGSAYEQLVREMENMRVSPIVANLYRNTRQY